METIRKTIRAVHGGWIAALALGLTAAPAHAETFPDKPVHIVVPFAAGGGSDMVARMTAERLGAKWGQPVIVDNRPGAGGSLGTAYVAKSPGDGYTLLLSDASAVTINPALYPKLPYAANDLKPVVNAGTFAIVAVVPKTSPYHSLADVLAADKRKPGSISVASSGVGSSTHLTLEMINAMTGSRLIHVPYKGGGQAVTDLAGGQVDMMLSGFNATLMELIRSGKLEPIAVSTGRRLQVLPNVKTFAESGLTGVDLVSAQSVFAPAAIGDERLRQLNRDFDEVLQSPDIREKWAQAGLLPFQPQSLADVNAWFAKESQRWGTLIQEKHISVD